MGKVEEDERSISPILFTYLFEKHLLRMGPIDGDWGRSHLGLGGPGVGKAAPSAHSDSTVYELS